MPTAADEEDDFREHHGDDAFHEVKDDAVARAKAEQGDAHWNAFSKGWSELKNRAWFYQYWRAAREAYQTANDAEEADAGPVAPAHQLPAAPAAATAAGAAATATATTRAKPPRIARKGAKAGSAGLLSRLDNMSPAAQNMRAALVATLLSPEEQAQREHAHACRAPGDDVHGLLEREHARADSIRARIAASQRRATATAAAAATADLPQPWWWPHQS